jgi:hypothetical protein
MTRGTLTVRVRGVPFPIEFADWTHDRLFHTVEFQGGDSQEILVFIGGIGSPIPGGSRTLTEADTNIPRSGDTGLQEGWEMLVYSIQIEVVREMARNSAQQAFALQDSGATNSLNTDAQQYSRPPHVGGYDPTHTGSGGVLFDFMRKTFHRFAVNQKVQSEGPVEEYPQGSGIHVFGTTTGLEVAGNGPPSPRDQSAFVLPIWIRPNIAYVGKLRPQAALGISNGVSAAAWPFGSNIQGYEDWASSGTIFTSFAMGFDVRETLEGLLKRPVT